MSRAETDDIEKSLLDLCHAVQYPSDGPGPSTLVYEADGAIASLRALRSRLTEVERERDEARRWVATLADVADDRDPVLAASARRFLDEVAL